MTISTELRKAGPFTGNGVTTAFPFSFKVFAATDVTATRADTLGAETGLVLNTDFTVALNADQDAAPGGTVTLAAPLSTGYRLVVSSAVPNLQPTDITNNGGFYPRVIEDALDRHVAQVQQIDEKVGRALKVAITSPLGDQALPSPVAGMLIGWNESSDGLKNYAPIGGTLLGQQLAAADGSSLVGFRQSGAGAVVRTAQDKMREWVSIKDFGGSPNASPEQNASALVAAFSAHNQVYFPDGVYEFSYSVASGHNSLVTITDRSGIRITGRGATLKDVSAYGGDYLTDVFKFVRCKDIYVDLNYDAIPRSNPEGAYPEGIGYAGSSFLYFEEGCTNIKVDSRIDNARYGVRSGGHSAPSYGYCSKFDLRLTCYKTGYPAALYLAGDVVVDIRSDYQHRALYLAGCNNVRGSVTYTGFTYATVAVLLTSSVTVVSAVDADRRARGCSGVDLLVVDNGSLGTVSARAIAGLAQQWKAPDTFFDDVQLHIVAKTSDANRTLAAFRLENTLGWYATNRFSNLKISGVIDRSAQTLAASSWANISIDGINSGEASPYSTSPKFSNVVFEDFNVINGAVTGNFDTIRVPNLENRMTFSRFHTGTTLSLIARAGEVSVDKSTVGNFVTGDIVARLNLLESTYGTIGSGITAYPFQWYAGSTFTPVLVGSTTAGVGTYTAQLGYYTRIGNRVHFHLNLGWSAHTGTGNMKITGLPFTSSNSTFCPVTIVPADITSPAGTSIAAMVPASEAAINLYSIATATSVFAPLAMDTSGSCWIGGSYEVA